MEIAKIIERIISVERFQSYLSHHNGDEEAALDHYKTNILISESFYPLLSILEVGLRNAIDFQLSKRFGGDQWFDNHDFVVIVSKFQTDRISEARANILSEKKSITPGRIISQLSFGFWTSLFEAKFEAELWKSLRLSFPNCPKRIRTRKTMSRKFNKIRKLRNRIFHHDAVSWDVSVLNSYKDEILEAIEWLHKDLIGWIDNLHRVDEVISNRKLTIER